jgi:PncC family amidohydrolase
MDAEPTDGRDLHALAARIQDVCLAHGWTVATAESCTGGLVADTLTDVPGSSGYVLGGIVAYADRIKAALLGVDPELIAARGAVSAHVAKAMALGARERFGTTFGLAVTGIAGPGGGSATKPVGLTFIAVATPARVDIRRHTWTGDRIANKQASAGAVLALLLRIAERQAARIGASAEWASTEEATVEGPSIEEAAPGERTATSVTPR